MRSASSLVPHLLRRTGFGVAIRGDVAVAVRVRGDVLLAHEQATREPEEEWSAFLTRLLLLVRGRSWRVPRLGVCVADRRCRVVPLFGEASDATAQAVAAGFRAQPEAYAIAGTDGLVAGSVWRRSDAWHGVLMSKVIADALLAASRSASVELVAVAPSTEPESDDLAALAMGASTLRPDDPVVIDPDGAVRLRRATTRRRAVMGTVSVAALLWALLAPSVAVYRGTRFLERESAAAEATLATAGARATVNTRAAALQQRSDALTRDRGRASALLHDIARVLPESSAVTALRMGDDGGSVTLLAPRVADSLKRLTTVPGLRQARVTGSIVEEDHGGVALQRVTLTWSVADGGRD